MVNTSHAGLYSIAGIVIGKSLSVVCGHEIIPDNIDYMAVVGALFATFLDMYKRRNSLVTPSTK